MSKQRREHRVEKKLMISFEGNDFDNLGVTEDISKFGMKVAARKELPTHQEVEISIAIPGEVYKLKGEVVWCRGPSDNDIPDEIGIKITEAPPDYLNYVEFIKHKKTKPGQPKF